MFPIGVLGSISRPDVPEAWNNRIIDPTFLNFRASLRKGSVTVVEFEVS
jgi:hypothetical protein